MARESDFERPEGSSGYGGSASQEEGMIIINAPGSGVGPSCSRNYQKLVSEGHSRHSK